MNDSIVTSKLNLDGLDLQPIHVEGRQLVDLADAKFGVGMAELDASGGDTACCSCCIVCCCCC
jgi:hypothetical protein